MLRLAYKLADNILRSSADKRPRGGPQDNVDNNQDLCKGTNYFHCA